MKQFATQAFPSSSDRGYTPGMELRDYFAAKAITPMVAAGYYNATELSARCYEIADAMIKAREK